MKIIITGCTGQLGSIMVNKLSPTNEICFFSHKELDITNRDSVKDTVEGIKPNIILNCASYNNVEKAECEQGLAKKVNVEGVKNLVDISNKLGSKMIHISTDYVFDGKKKAPYIESDKPNPLNYYGMTKYLGEEAIKNNMDNYLILRTSWLYSYKENNFVSTIKKISKINKRIKVINDQIGSPTNAYELADVIKDLIEHNCNGMYHCTGNGSCSWYDFSKEIIRLSNLKCEVEESTTEEYKQVAVRPKYSVLENYNLKKTIGDSMKNWEKSLQIFLNEKRNL